eukprot:m.25943 g.25943  ORF g.25943 m.25943 type:complete len:397 (+) comp11648_c0_seq1:289-1479(+)
MVGGDVTSAIFAIENESIAEIPQLSQDAVLRPNPLIQGIGKVEVLAMDQSISIAVVGAGVMGLSSALELAKQIPSCHITILAEKFTPDTVSDGAGALLRPIFLEDTPEQDQSRWCTSTFSLCYDLIRQGRQEEAGMTLCSGYDISGQERPAPYWKDDVLGFRHVDKAELTGLGPAWAKGTQAWYYTTVMIDSSRCLEWLQSECQAHGVVLQQRKVLELSELYCNYDIVVNCTGCGAAQLSRDNTLKPARGVTVRLNAPWVKQFMIASDLDSYGEGEFTHIFPRSRTLVVGGVKQFDSPSIEVSDSEVKAIVDRAVAFDSSLRQAEIINTWAGHRPVRPSVCLTSHPIQSRRATFLVHNYGHGGSGLTLWQGCAEDVCYLVQRYLTTQHGVQWPSKL